MKGAKRIMFGILLLEDIGIVTIVLYQDLGAIAGGIFAVASFIAHAYLFCELCLAPMTREEPSTDNQ